MQLVATKLVRTTVTLLHINTYSKTNVTDCNTYCIFAGAHPRGRRGGPGPSPCDLKNARFSVFLPLNYVIFVYATRVLKPFAMRKDRGSL